MEQNKVLRKDFSRSLLLNYRVRCLIIKEKVLEGFKRYFGENSDFHIMFRNAYLKGLEWKSYEGIKEIDGTVQITRFKNRKIL
jgi:hypothetical protein